MNLDEVDSVLLAVCADVVTHQLVAVLAEDVNTVSGTKLHWDIKTDKPELTKRTPMHIQLVVQSGCSCGFSGRVSWVYSMWLNSTAMPTLTKRLQRLLVSTILRSRCFSNASLFSPSTNFGVSIILSRD